MTHYFDLRLFLFLSICFSTNLQALENSHPTIYKICKLPTNKPIYNKGTHEVCGIESIKTYANESCGAELYKSCRLPNHPIEGHSRVSTYTHVGYLLAAPGSIDCKVRVNNALNGKESIYLQSPKNIYEDDRNTIRFEPVESNPWYSYFIEITQLIPNTTNENKIYIRQQDIAPSKWVVNYAGYLTPPTYDSKGKVVDKNDCTFSFHKQSPVRASQRNELCGVETYKVCDHITYNECQNERFGILDYEFESKEECGIDISAIASLSENQYFSLLLQQLTSLMTYGDNATKWRNMFEISSDSYLATKKIKITQIIQLRSLIYSINIQNSVNEDDKKLKLKTLFSILDLYTRISYQYINQAAQDILIFQSHIADIKLQNKNTIVVINDTIRKIEALDINHQLKKSILTTIKNTNTKDIRLMIQTLTDLIGVIKSDIQIAKSDMDDLLKTYASVSDIFKLNYIYPLLHSKNFNQVLLRLNDARVLFRSSDWNRFQPQGEFLFLNYQKNLQYRISKELEAAAKFHSFALQQKPLTLEYLGIDEYSKDTTANLQILEIVENLELSMGTLVSKAQFQLINMIEKTIIIPLNQLQEELEK